MAKEKRDLSPAEAVLAKWAHEAQDPQGIMPDYDPDFSASFPNLWVFLTWREVGKFQKQPGSVSLRAEGTGWRLQYFDPTAKRSCAVLAPTLMEALRKLDQAVVSEETVWTSTDRRTKEWKERKKSVQ